MENKILVGLSKIAQSNSPKLNLSAALTGIAAGYGAILFRGLIGYLQNFLFHGKIDFHLISPVSHSMGLLVIVIPAIGIALVAWISRFASEVKGHGVPEVIEAVLTRGGKIRPRVVGMKALTSAITIASGGSVGREGPIVQVGAAAGSTIGQLLNFKSKHVKILVGCGAAGAIGATFNTPIAGVIFAIELIVLEMRAKSFVPLVIASVFATVVARFHLGNELAFHVPTHILKTPQELIFYAGLALLAGSSGAFFVRSVYYCEDLFAKIKTHYLIKAFLGGLLLGVTGYFYPQIFGVGYDTIELVLNNHSSIGLMIALFVLKILMTSITLAAGGSGGVFAPSLFIGAMLGGSYGWVIHNIFPAITADYGAYALVGMAAVFTASSRATLTAIVILFEMTMDYSIILPLMFVCVLADQISIALSPEGTIYSIKLKRKGLSFLSEFGVNILEITPVQQIMTTDLITIQDDTSVDAANEIASKHPHMVYPVLNSRGILLGQVRGRDLKQAAADTLSNSKVTDFMIGAPSAVYPSDSALKSLNKLEMSRDPRVVVVDPVTKKLLGIVSPIDFVRLSLEERD